MPIDGPTWELARDDHDGHSQAPTIEPCAACTSLGYVDKATRYCQACWRAWRFSSDEDKQPPVCGRCGQVGHRSSDVLGLSEPAGNNCRRVAAGEPAIT